jgi:hypothetical protein
MNQSQDLSESAARVKLGPKRTKQNVNPSRIRTPTSKRTSSLHSFQTSGSYLVSLTLFGCVNIEKSPPLISAGSRLPRCRHLREGPGKVIRVDTEVEQGLEGREVYLQGNKCLVCNISVEDYA